MVQPMNDVTRRFLKNRETAYGLTFSQPHGQVVLHDMIRFSKFIEGPVGRDQLETYRLIGRQDFIRRIQQHMNLETDQLYALFNGDQVPDLIKQHI